MIATLREAIHVRIWGELKRFKLELAEMVVGNT